MAVVLVLVMADVVMVSMMAGGGGAGGSSRRDCYDGINFTSPDVGSSNSRQPCLTVRAI